MVELGFNNVPCEQQNTAWRIKNKLNRNGKAIYVFKYPTNVPRKNIEEVRLPCRKCNSCRLAYAKEWAIRSWHEASEYDDNSFLTLTFNDEHLHPGGILVKSDFQNFMKRLRKFVDRYEFNYDIGKYVKRPIPISKMDASVRPLSGNSVRYTHCGEYGEESLRPHHHACLFNIDFKDKYQFATSNGLPLYNSRTLDWLWSEKRTNYEKAMSIYDEEEFNKFIKHRGWAVIGSVTFESAAYVARYITKKTNRTYSVNDVPEYFTQSRNPGIGRAWIEKYHSDIYPFDFIGLTENRKMKIPRYYDKVFEKIDDTEYNLVKERRVLMTKKINSKKTLEDQLYTDRTHKIISNQIVQNQVRSLK